MKRTMSIWYAGFFAYFSINLLISLIRTIVTNPGNVPEDKEWDMTTDSESDYESERKSQHSQESMVAPLSNRQIDFYKDYKYLNTAEGPLVPF